MKSFKKTSLFENGFTLIEILIYFTLLSIILLITVDLFFRILESSVESTSKNSVEIEGGYVLKRLAYDIRQAESISVPTNPGDSSSSLKLIINGSDHDYFLDSFVLNFDTGETTPVTSNSVQVQAIEFTHVAESGGKPTIKINFTLESTTPSRDGTFESKDFESVFSVR